MEQQKQLAEAFAAWLKENNATVVVKVRTPLGEIVSPENFLPPNWTVVVAIAPKG
jgi:hypothetical protein